MPLGRLRGGGESARSSLNVIVWRQTVEYGSLNSNSLLYFMLFCETHDLVWEIISVSEKRMNDCIVKIIDNVVEKKCRRWVISFKSGWPSLR